MRYNKIIIFILTLFLVSNVLVISCLGEDKKSEAENSKAVTKKPTVTKEAVPVSSEHNAQEPFQKQKILDLQKWENNLNSEAKRLDVLKSDIDKRIEENNKILAQINAGIKFINDANTVRFQNLVSVYEAMKPVDAAKSLSELDINILVSLFSAMKVPKAAKILSVMEPAKAGKIVTNMTGIMKNIPKQ
ncbi:MAG: hypothetical protein HQK91_06410 [Nitrospirae bacterium]|nr:hypothetical protein [Nitrospirota bacterium]MBF0541065.1 hypothetical protein [Nitrospirota bacterium]